MPLRIGLAAEGDELIAELDAEIRRGIGRSTRSSRARQLLFAYIDPTDLSQIGFYTIARHPTGIPRAVSACRCPTVVEDESAKTDDFYATRSAPSSPIGSPTSTSS